MGLDTVELVMSVEEHFGVDIPDDDASTLMTVGMLHEWLMNELRRLDRPNLDSTAVFGDLRNIICDQFGIAVERVVPDARFVQDLHLD
jgi:acyl carrier protein